MIPPISQVELPIGFGKFPPNGMLFFQNPSLIRAQMFSTMTIKVFH